MTNREHFIATLQVCYFGDRNAFEEIIRIYDEKENIIKEVRENIEKHTTKFNDIYIPASESWYLLEILDKVGDEK